MTADVVPLLVVLGCGLATPSWSRDAPLLTFAVTAGLAIVLTTYLFWRLTVTVLPVDGPLPRILFVWIVFLAEFWLWYETILLCLILSRRTDRSKEADHHETRLNASRADLPDVDVFIATYNEPVDVLEKTIAGAMALDWPHARLHIHVLDDGRREWLRAYCEDRGIHHLTRPDNAHAKAGNINAALRRTTSPFILVLDADFVPQQRMLMRAMGFFEDSRVGIVQMPHHFFNATPLQTNLDMRATLPDEQRFFFDVIQPGRDGWDCAFCCGSNGIIRRTAIDAIGGAMPTESITEDMLLTMAMLRKGYITRYLGERLAIGLAPETLDAYFVQRARWAQGAIQLLYTPKGPLGPGLTILQRCLFNPSHWLSQSFCQPLAMATPAIFLLTGVPPLVGATLEEIMRHQLPAIAAGMLYVRFLAPREFSPLASTVESVLQSFRLMPVVLRTLFRPHGRGFKVTPKGSDAGLSREDRFSILVALAMLCATGFGLMLNTDFASRIVEAGELLPVVAFWSVFNMVVLLLVVTAAVPRPVPRGETRFDLREPLRLHLESGIVGGEATNLSLSGILLGVDGDAETLREGDWAGIELADVGIVPARLTRTTRFAKSPALGFEFVLPRGALRDSLIRKVFTTLPLQPPPLRSVGSAATMIARIFASHTPLVATPTRLPTDSFPEPPAWLARLAAWEHSPPRPAQVV